MSVRKQSKIIGHETDLAKLVRTLAKRHNLNVKFRGLECRAGTNGKDILLPSVEGYLTDDMDVARPLHGLVDHEVAEIVEGNPPLQKKLVGNNIQLKLLLNAINDPWVDKEWHKRYPGSVSDFEDLWETSADLIREKIDTAPMFIKIAVAINVYLYGREMDFFDPLTMAIVEEVKPILDEHYPDSTGVRDNHTIAVKVLEKLQELSQDDDQNEEGDGQSDDIGGEGEEDKNKQSGGGKGNNGEEEQQEEDESNSGGDGNGDNEEDGEGEQDGDEEQGSGQGENGEQDDEKNGNGDQSENKNGEDGNGEQNDNGEQGDGNEKDGDGEQSTEGKGSETKDTKLTGAEQESLQEALCENITEDGEINMNSVFLEHLQTQIAIAGERDFNDDMYLIYTTEGDKWVEPQRLSQIQYLNIKSKMASFILPLRRKLNNVLMDMLEEGWMTGQEEGRLDPARVGRIMIRDNVRDIRRVRLVRENLNTAVSIWVDHSGSMHNRRIELATYAVIIIVEALSNIGIPLQVVGWTTCNDNASRRWNQASAEEQETYIRWGDNIFTMYKNFDEGFGEARLKLASMFSPYQMENTHDGESVRLAAELLMQRTEKRKILIVVGDGNPCPAGMMGRRKDGTHRQHLKNVCEDIEQKTPIELIGLSILSPDMCDFYSNAIMIDSEDGLPGALIGGLCSKLKEGRNRRKAVWGR